VNGGSSEDADQGVAAPQVQTDEAFEMGRLIGLPALARAVSHQTMKRRKG
jgi:hypothetical protein